MDTFIQSINQLSIIPQPQPPPPPTPTPTSSFLSFSNLPTELRLKIWKLLKEDTRVIQIQYRTKRHTFDNGKSMSRPGGWASNQPVPILLHICHESRELGLKYYQLAFGSYFHDAKVYFDFDRDILRFGGLTTDEPSFSRDGPQGYVLDLFLGGGPPGADDADKVKYLSIDVHTDLFDRAGFCFDDVREFKVLKKLELWGWPEHFDFLTMDDLLHEATPQVSADSDPDFQLVKEKLRGVMRNNEDWKPPTILLRSATYKSSWVVYDIPIEDKNVEADEE